MYQSALLCVSGLVPPTSTTTVFELEGMFTKEGSGVRFHGVIGAPKETEDLLMMDLTYSFFLRTGSEGDINAAGDKASTWRDGFLAMLGGESDVGAAVVSAGILLEDDEEEDSKENENEGAVVRVRYPILNGSFAITSSKSTSSSVSRTEMFDRLDRADI